MTQQPVRQPSAWTRALAAIGAMAFIGAAIVLSNSSPAAAGLETFTSCDDLRDHLEAATPDFVSLPTTGSVADTPAAEVAGGVGGDARDDSGGTNTQVAGIDELDIVDVLDDGRSIAARDDRIVLIDATGTQILATLDTAGPTQITFDEERSTLWTVGGDWETTTLARAVLDGNTFSGTSSWEVAGRLVDLRRDGGRVHLVVVDGELGIMPMDTDVSGGVRSDGEGTLPFDGTSPVACDQVLHSPLLGGPATTLVTSFDATGELTPVAATEIVGAGDNVLVTDSALYVSTPSFDGNKQVTGIHRFDLDGLSHTGSGSVEGRLLNQFALDEHAGHLRAAITVGDVGFVGLPMPVEGDVAVAPSGGAATEPPVTEPPITVPGAPLNEIVTFDLDGALDVVGRSARFGHPGETLQGIRFDGDIAYAVTFLQTDPLYVIDLSQPASPAVLGQIEIPGFSAYLHPISPTQVIGFGPGGEDQIVARLFDISDPTSPRLLDTADIGEDSPIVYDHHALRADGDRLVIAANRYVSERPARCGPVAGTEEELNDLYRQMEDLYRQLEGQPPSDTIPPAVAELQERIDALSECVYPNMFPQARIVVLTPDGGSLQVRSIDTDAGDAQRILPVGDGYLVVGAELTRVGSDGATQAVLG